MVTVKAISGTDVQRIETPSVERLEWWFTACSLYGDERHDLCPGNITLRNDYSGSCVCPCHRV